MARGTKRLRMYERDLNDFDVLNSFDSELIEIASPPIKWYEFDVRKTLEGKFSGIDELYGEAEIINEEKLQDLYKQGFDGEFDPTLTREGEEFKPYKIVYGYYQEPTWTQELTRLGIDEPEELAITFNYQKLLSDAGKEIMIGDVVQTFRGKVYRVLDAYVADEVVSWNYIHYNIIARKIDPDNIILPDNPDIPTEPSHIP